MTRKDYELLARVLKFETEQYLGDRNEAKLVIRELADMFATELNADNPRFDRDLFFTKCGITP